MIISVAVLKGDLRASVEQSPNSVLYMGSAHPPTAAIANQTEAMRQAIIEIIKTS
jgi:hypothetical protein